MMIDLKEYINSFTQDETQKYNIISFLSNNNWFGNKPRYENESVILSDAQVTLFSEKIKDFLNEKDNSNLYVYFENKFPLTYKYFMCFVSEEHPSEELTDYLIDFFLYRLKKDIFLYNDDEIEKLLEDATNDLYKYFGDFLTFFLAWLRNKTKTSYFKDYIMSNRFSMDIQNEAYDMDTYLHLLYYLYNQDYIEENEMYIKAANSKNYTDTWLFLALHYICSLRLPDLQRIFHPTLPYPPEEVIQKIKNGEFTNNDARMVLLSIITRLCVLPFSPSKTENHSYIEAIKFEIPVSAEDLLGTLFALAEAHYQLSGSTGPLIRKLSTYDQITRYMGDEIGMLFLESDFRSRSANKSYLQAIYLLSDEILNAEGENIKFAKYELSSKARSHKGSYSEFASQTATYLKDAKFNRLTPQFVAHELMERGVLSSIISSLLKIITNGAYSDLSVTNQTKLIKELNLSPLEVERIVGVSNKAMNQARKVVSELVQSNVNIMALLHNIGNGSAVSKQPENECILTAIGVRCPYDQRNCIACGYGIKTRSTFYLLIGEYNRIIALLNSTDNALMKKKYEYIIYELILPNIDEMLFCIKENYGEKTFKEYEQLLKENITYA